jgi:hypothetical protein
MPDRYWNAARAFPPWNYDFKFPGPPQGQRDLIKTTSLQLVLGVGLAVAAAAFALYGRPWLERVRVFQTSAGSAAHRPEEQEYADHDEGQRPDLRRS